MQRKVTLQVIARKIADVDESGGAASEKWGLGISSARRVAEAFRFSQSSMEAVKPLCQIPESQQRYTCWGFVDRSLRAQCGVPIQATGKYPDHV